jgi:hypothetical protein
VVGEEFVLGRLLVFNLLRLMIVLQLTDLVDGFVDPFPVFSLIFARK